MFNKSNIVTIILFLTVLICSCKFFSSVKKSVCDRNIQISVFDSSIKKYLSEYKIYEITNYPESVILKLQTVAEDYKYKDSLGITCLPLLKGPNEEVIRKFVLVKNGYVYTEYYLKNKAVDTLLNAIRIDK